MSDDIEKLSRDVKDADTAFKDAISSDKDLVNYPPPAAASLNTLRACVEHLSTTDLLYARQNKAEARLWDAHQMLHDIYKRRVKEVRAASPARPVETRKLIKAYLEFMKDGQRGYRMFITRLNQRYGAIPELKQIAGTTPATSPSGAQASPIRDACHQSCYQSLICLGDLARWRASEKLDKDPSWGPAIGYYDLAIVLRPMSGMAFNQRSVIAQYERDHLRTTYYVYRSIVATEPFEKWQGNLDAHMASLLRRWGTPELSPAIKSAGPDSSSKALTAWFLRLHTLCYVGDDFKDRDEMQAEVLNRMEALIMGSQSSKLLMKIVLINMAAQHTAILRLEKAERSRHTPIMQSFYFYQRLNIGTLRLLLETWSKILGYTNPSVARPSLGPLRAPKSQIPHITNVLLPLLRVYMLWLATNYRYFVLGPDSVLDSSVVPEATSLWDLCPQVLSATRTVYPAADLVPVPYLLDEDVDVRCFEPLHQTNTSFLRMGKNGVEKPRFNDPKVKRSPPQHEMSSRIRDVEWLGQWLAGQEKTPFGNEGDAFDFETALASPRSITAVPTRTNASDDTTSISKTTTAPATNTHPTRQSPPSSPKASSALLRSPVRFQQAKPQVTPPVDRQEEFAKSMVDNLVGPDESPHPLHRTGSALDVTTQTEDSPSSFIPTPMSAQSAARQRPESLQNPAMYAGGDWRTFTSGMHSPLLFGNGGVWGAPGKRQSTGHETPSNGQGR